MDWLKLKNNIKRLLFFFIEGLSVLFERNRSFKKAEIKNILVIGGGYLGDLLLIFPAIESLSAYFPNVPLSLMVSSNSKKILTLFPKKGIISSLIEFNPEKEHNNFLKKLSLAFSLRSSRFDLIYSPNRGKGMRGMFLMNLIIGAPHRIGFRIGKVGLFNTIKIDFKDDTPIIKQNLALLKAAGVEIITKKIGIAVPDAAELAARELLNKHQLDDSCPLISIHPGASWNSKYKCWPIERFILLIGRLVEEYNANIIVIGSNKEAKSGEIIANAIGNSNVINLVGKTSVAQMAAVIKKSDFFIGNDSGPLHIALALDIPCIAIFGATAPQQILSETDKCIVVNKRTGCSPCYLHQPDFDPPCESPKCLDEISVEDTMKAFQTMLYRFPL
jgi:lipopolysaccharide heptosyltransferase II